MSDPTKAKTKDERVRFVVERMRANEWPMFPATLAYRQSLAEAWGISEVTVRGYAAEAHRMIALDPEERAKLQQDLGQELLDIAREARREKNGVTGLPDYGNAIKATEVAAKFLGIEFEAKVRHSGEITIESIDEIRKRLDGAGSDGAERSGGAG